jgi:putative DNA primase/helicase
MIKAEEIFKLMYEKLSVMPTFAPGRRFTIGDRDEIVGCYRQAVLNSGMICVVGKWRMWNGLFYDHMEPSKFKWALEESCSRLGVPVMMWKQLYEICKTAINGSVGITYPSRGVLCFQNGVVDCCERKRVLNEPSSSLAVFTVLPYAYDPKAKCPMFEKFLEQVLPDECSRMCLQELMGSMFLERGRMKIEKMGLLWGTGANGKSVFAETMKGVIGFDKCSSFDPIKLTRGEDAERALSEVEGKLLNYCDEITTKALNDVRFKSLVSGERQMARALFEPYREIKELPLIMGNANDIPEITRSHAAIMRRVFVFKFMVKIAEEDQDRSLPRKLEAEYPGILNWILKGRDRLEDNGGLFTRSQEMADNTGLLVSGSDERASFPMFLLSQGYEPVASGSGHHPTYKTSEVLRLEYVQWRAVMGATSQEPMTKNIITRYMNKAGYISRRREGMMVYSVYVGKGATVSNG